MATTMATTMEPRWMHDGGTVADTVDTAHGVPGGAARGNLGQGSHGQGKADGNFSACEFDRADSGPGELAEGAVAALHPEERSLAGVGRHRDGSVGVPCAQPAAGFARPLGATCGDGGAPASCALVRALAPASPPTPPSTHNHTPHP